MLSLTNYCYSGRGIYCIEEHIDPKNDLALVCDSSEQKQSIPENVTDEAPGAKLHNCVMKLCPHKGLLQV